MSDRPGSLKIDKETFAVGSVFEPSDEPAYWHSRSPYERLQAIESLRRLNYGIHRATSRLQRILEVVERSSS